MDISTTSSSVTKYSANPVPGEFDFPTFNGSIDDTEMTLYLEKNQTKSWGSLRIPCELFDEFVAFVATVQSQIASAPEEPEEEEEPPVEP